MPNRKALNAAGQHLLDAFAMWDNYRLIQPNAQGFTIEKQTGPQSSWLIAGAGKRSTGYVFVGDVSGGLGVGAKDFWQSYPAGLEVRQARSNDRRPARLVLAAPTPQPWTYATTTPSPTV